jgi:hypothetical protein
VDGGPAGRVADAEPTTPALGDASPSGAEDAAVSREDAASSDGRALDASASDAAQSPDAAVIDGCSIARVRSSSDCGDDCGAHLRLPAPNDWYCTQACGAPADCAAAPSTTCAPYGACVPRCNSDAGCRALGFARCDTAAGACDTL